MWCFIEWRDLGRELVGASYGAVALLGEEGILVQFVTSGISRRRRDLIGRLPKGEGVLGLVLGESRPLRLGDLSQHPRAAGVPPHHPKMKSFLGVPMVFKGRVLGDFYLTNKIGAPEFSEVDETIVVLFAAQAAVAIENARRFESEARRSAQLDGLNRIGNELTRILDLEKLLHEGFPYQNVEVFWVDQPSSTIKLRSLAGAAQGKLSPGTTWQAGAGIPGWVVKHKKTVICNDVSQEPRYQPLPGFEASAQLAVPVIVKGEVAAVISVHGMEFHAFDESDARTLETLADQLAVAIENLQLLRQYQEHSRRLAVVEKRDRIGRDLHDGVIQSIYAVGLTLEDIASQAKNAPDEVRGRVEGVVDDLNRVISDIRSYIMDLRPRELQGRPLGEALASLIRYLEDRTGVLVTLDTAIDLGSLPEQHTVNLWHMFQEAFSNIEKYAQATQVTVSLPASDGYLNLEIADDGVGFDLEKVELGRGYRLPNIKDRAERLGGILVVDSSPGGGTRLQVSLPLDAARGTADAPGGSAGAATPSSSRRSGRARRAGHKAGHKDST